ncbi:hypothetical protein T492DRAFT_836536 [Pavlovales sp. CCMP2436]|nr:hypothetical protein T492DRAFT_836536 [Pavlovales sp. CCMP2436]
MNNRRALVGGAFQAAHLSQTLPRGHRSGDGRMPTGAGLPGALADQPRPIESAAEALPLLFFLNSKLRQLPLPSFLSPNCDRVPRLIFVVVGVVGAAPQLDLRGGVAPHFDLRGGRQQRKHAVAQRISVGAL